MSPFLLQKMRSDGIELEMFSTFLGMGWTIITTNPAIKNFADLKGRSIAATVAFSAFDYLQIYAKKTGINLRKDISIVDATNVLMLAQLEAGRVDAILAYEPNATMLMARNPNAKVALYGVDAWKAVTGDLGWDLGLVVRTDYLKKNPGVLPRLFKMYRDAATFATNNPDEADAIVSSGKYFTKGIPPGTIASGLKNKRLILEVRPTWEPETNAQIWKMLQAGLDGGYIPALPTRQAVVSVAPK
jgi:ABC-type taurine transport system substrate-binding protein